MNTKILKIAALFFIVLSIAACKKSVNKTEASEAEEVATTSSDEVIYLASNDSTSVAWKGTAPTKFHNGFIKISEGYFAFDNGKLKGGNFVLDMKTIEDVSLENEEFNAKLEGHLASADFFDVEKHPYGVFEITEVNETEGKLMVKGNLTLKSIKKNIEFPATLNMNGDQVQFESEPFNIDRTEWDVMYNSGKLKETIKDKLIHDDVELIVKVQAVKK